MRRRTACALAAALLVGCGRAEESAAPPVAGTAKAAERGLRGRLVDPDGRPVAGARLVATPRPRFRGAPDPRVAAETKVADDGDWALPDLADGDWELTCDVGGAVNAPAGEVRVPDVSRFDVVLPFGATFLGRVVDDDTEAPLAGVRVVARSHDGRALFDVVSDVEGSFSTLSRRAGAWMGMYTFARPGEAPQEREHSDCVILLVEGETEHVSVRAGHAEKAARLFGFVTGPSGPVVGARVIAWTSDETRLTTTTDEVGQYELVVPRGATVIRAESAGLVQHEAHLPALVDEARWPESAPDACKFDVFGDGPSTRHDVTLSLPEPWRTISVAGRVVDEDGAPIAGAKIVGEGDPRAAATSGADGAFSVSGVPFVEHGGSFVVSGDGRLPRTVMFIACDGAPHEEAIDVVLKRSPRVRGRVTSAAAAPLADARVLVVVGGSDDGGVDRRAGPPVVLDATTDAQGAYSLGFVPRNGQIVVHAELAGFATGETFVGWATDVEDGVGDVVLHPTTTLAGRVVVAGTTTPAVGATLAVEVGLAEERRRDGLYQPSYEPHVVRAVTGADGAFRIEGVSTAMSRLLVLGGGAWAATELVLDAPGPAPIVVEARPACVVEGRVAWRKGGGPAAGVTLTLWTSPWNDEPNVGAAAPRRDTSADGRFVFRGLAPGKYWMHLEGGDSEIRTKDVGPIEAGSRGCAVEVEPGLVVRGRVVGADGEPVKDGLVRVSRGGRHVQIWSGHSIEKDGAFEIVGLDDGPYQVDVDVPGHALASVRGAHGGGAPVEVRLERGLSVRGKAFAPDGAPLVGARLCARAVDPADDHPDWARRATRTGTDGSFELEHVEPGLVRVVVDEPYEPDTPLAPADAVFEAGAVGVEIRCVAPPKK